MAGDELFGELPEQGKPQADAGSPGAPRMREPQRDQIELQAVDIESLIGEDHPARVIWAYVVGLDLSELAPRGVRVGCFRPGYVRSSRYAGLLAEGDDHTLNFRRWSSSCPPPVRSEPPRCPPWCSAPWLPPRRPMPR